MDKCISTLESTFLELEKSPSIEKIHQLFKCMCEHLSLCSQKPQLILFSLDNSASIKKYVASSVLRIFDTCSDYLWDDQELRLKIIKLLDDVYSKRVYKILKIDQTKPNHEKLPMYQSISSDVLKDINNIHSSINSLETALKIRKPYMQCLKNPCSLIFTESHIYNPALFSDERLSEFFGVFEQYTKADRMQKLATYQKLSEIHSSYGELSSANIANKYSKSFITQFINTIFDVAKVDFELSDLQTPASVQIIKSKRKYPIHTTNKSFQIKSVLRNDGPGVAFDFRVNIIAFDECIIIENEEVNFGDLDVGEYELKLKARVSSHCDKAPNVMGIISWSDYQGIRKEIEFEIEVTAQNSNIDWDKIKYLQPYSLESVDNEDDLIGRKNLLEAISSKLSLRKMESSIIYGQKRVGKTSIARTIQNKFRDVPNYLGIFIETGSLDKSSPINFIKSLGEKIIKILKAHLRLLEVKFESFNGSLYPLVSFIEDVMLQNQDLKVVIVIDEFDEIPSQLYPYTEAGDSFFHSLRSLSGESGDGRISLILVGGENMGVIMQTTDKLNKFDAYNVGYFDKSKSWSQFKELVESPVKGIMEYSDDAIVALYDVTEGNPFYTKFIAKNLYIKMANDHYSYISKDEMNDCIHETMQNMEAINLSHFWSDCIRVENQENRDLIETHRRRFLIAFADQMRANHCVNKTKLISNLLNSEIPTNEVLDSFLSRNILIDNGDGNLNIKPNLFQSWLVEKGVYNLRASFADMDSISAYNDKENANYISETELNELVFKWELYKGIEITALAVRTWLDQFENNDERQLSLKLLKNIRFYGELLIREKLKTIHEIIRKSMPLTLGKSERVRKDVLISCFGTSSKSGPTYIRMYASENKITTHNIKLRSEIKKTITDNQTVKAIVFIDDILATGNSILADLNLLNEECGDLLKEREILIVVGVICGVSDGIEMLTSKAKDFKFRLEVKVCDVLTEHDKALSGLGIFSDANELASALTLCKKYGVKLQKMQPLGYGNSQLLVVFKDNCPNNTLPIIWDSSNNPKWIPLFKRG
jgi:AAA+ ATPase superfamily predicted ATPase